MARIKSLSEVLGGVTRFGRLTVVGEAPSKVAASGFAAKSAFVRCDCGAGKVVRASDLKHGYTSSCGCLQRELVAVRVAERSRTHGQSGKLSRTSEYAIWSGMKDRCHNPNSGGYARYGARGISVCARWRDSFEAFYEDMGARPSKLHSLERQDNHGNYEPANCRWATARDQANNRRSSRPITIDGRTQSVTEWARERKVKQHMIFKRLENGWSERDAVMRPKRPKRGMA